MLTDSRKLQDKDRYYWYHGYALISVWYPVCGNQRCGCGYGDQGNGDREYHVSTLAKSGSISTQYFGEYY